MTPEQSLLIEAACRRLVYRYCALADAGRADEAAALYAPDGVLEIAGARFVGREAIERRLASAPPRQVSRHVCANLIVDPVSDREAQGSAYLLLFRDDPARPDAGPTLPLLVGEYEDAFVREDGQAWMFKSRSLKTTFRKSA